MMDWLLFAVEAIGFVAVVALVAFALFALLCVAKTPRDLPGSFYDSLDSFYRVDRGRRNLPKNLRRGRKRKD